MTGHARLQQQTGWLSAWVGPELVLMNGGAGAYISVSETGGRIWDLLQTPHTLGSLCEALAAEYDVDSATVQTEAEEFLDRMQQEGAILVADDARVA